MFNILFFVLVKDLFYLLSCDLTYWIINLIVDIIAKASSIVVWLCSLHVITKNLGVKYLLGTSFTYKP
jgi:hypothetical protein